MPRTLFKKPKDQGKQAAEPPVPPSAPSQPSQHGAPENESLPAYRPTAESGPDSSAGPEPEVNVTAAFEHLSPPSFSALPEVDTCLAHLKLLYAFEAMKEDVGYTDGLWGLWDTRADLGDVDIALPADQPGPQSAEEERRMVLSKIREKRWALFVARAVDRYEAWWNSLPKSALTVDDMMAPGRASYDQFPETREAFPWTSETMLPLDVLMVFHAHMLNPRAFLEDCMRTGRRALWATGMPWPTVNAALDTEFAYRVADADRAYWTTVTGRAWDNADDPMVKEVSCPHCKTVMAIPWTTCGVDEAGSIAAGSDLPGLVGKGYGDGKLADLCPSCYEVINKEMLAVGRFAQDCSELLRFRVPMPGTVLEPSTGLPGSIPAGELDTFPRTFPNRMVERVLASKVVELLDPQRQLRLATMAEVRNLVEDAIQDGGTINRINNSPSLLRKGRLLGVSRFCIRKMMGHYWENFSVFALDLGAAVLRQGIFGRKMRRIDWLHSPAARHTMARLIIKYRRFVSIMADASRSLCVPTLDVDLAWHTHQLTPFAYFQHTKALTHKFIDHDDKIDENRLSEGFEFTSKAYQARYGLVYSECTCWYCESIRSSHISSLGQALGMSQQERIAESLYSSGAAGACPADNSAHISAHNAVRSVETEERHRVTQHLRAMHQRQLEANYIKAQKRAAKKGRQLPPRNEYYDHWGYYYFMYSPFYYPMYISPDLYYGWNPGCIPAGEGAWANCAAGSCGSGGAAAGACGGPGGCTSGGGCGGGGCGGGGGGGGGGCGGGGC